MAVVQTFTNPAYVAMVRGVRDLHRLTASGAADDSPEADAIRDATDGPWEALSEVERQRVRYLSEDLVSLTEPSSAQQPMTANVRSEMVEVAEARNRGDWDTALGLLRRNAAYLAPAELSYLRGVIWMEAGDPETAALFLDHAIKLEPDSQVFLAIVRTLHRTAP
jgi:hypothetical protein